MKKFMVVSGFLGSGKTSIMMAVTNAMNASGRSASELTGDCICYQTDNLVDRLHNLFDGENAELVMSDIPGFGVGALEHVYHRLHDRGEYFCELAPFAVVTEARVLHQLRRKNSYLPEELNYILSAQLIEADLIILNKCDLMTDEEINECIKILDEVAAGTPVICVSALTGAGIGDLIEYISGHNASMKAPDIGYGGEAFSSAMGKISEYYNQFYVKVCCNTFNANDYLTSLANMIKDSLKDEGFDVPHLKLFAQGDEGDFCKIDLLGIGQPVNITRAMSSPDREDLPVILNASAVCPAQNLERIIGSAIAETSGKFNLSVTVFFKQCFGMGK